MAEIKQAYDAIIPEYEGLYSNDSGDSGGETVFGVARNIDTDWLGWEIVDSYKAKPGFPHNMEDDTLLVEMAQAYYKTNYWDKLHLDDVESQELAQKLFDVGINMGLSVAATFLQRILNVINATNKNYVPLKVDGICGAKTITALNNSRSPRNILVALKSLQGAKYISLAETNPVNTKFINGWLARI